MSVIEDSRKLMQDFLARELRAISSRLDSIEKRFDGVDKRFDLADARFDAVDENLTYAERKVDRRHNETMSAVAQMIEITMLRERVARLESGRDSHQ